MHMAEKLNVQVELVKLFEVKSLNNEKQTKYRNCHVKFTDPQSGDVTTTWARIWETTLENGTKVGDMLNAEVDQWTTAEGKSMVTVTVFGGSDAQTATLDLFKNALVAKAPATDLNKPM
jgi:hypothetical protein